MYAIRIWRILEGELGVFVIIPVVEFTEKILQ